LRFAKIENTWLAEFVMGLITHQLILQQLHKIQMQITVVARPRNQQDHGKKSVNQHSQHTAIRLDGGFFCHAPLCQRRSIL